MSKCALEITVERQGPFHPGETLRGFVGVTVNQVCTCHKLTLALEWFTSGTGNATQQTTHVDVLFVGDWPVGKQHLYPFEAPVPAGPFSYEGQHITLQWRLTAMADIPWDTDPRCEQVIVVQSNGPTPIAYDPGPGALPSSSPQSILPMLIGGVFVLMGAPILALGLLIGIGTLARGDVQGAFNTLLTLACPLLFVSVGVFAAYRGSKDRIQRWRFGTLTLQHPSIVHPGGVLEAELVIRPRNHASIDAVEFTLVREEVSVRAIQNKVNSAGNRAGTHIHAKQVAKQVAQGATQLSAKTPLTIHAAIQVPPDAGHSFKVPSSQLRWRGIARIKRSGQPDIVEESNVVVRPPGP